MPLHPQTPLRGFKPRHAVCWLAGALLSAGAAAQTGGETTTLALDAERSHADFEVKVLWLIGVHGRFGRVHGSVRIDRFHGSVVADAQIDVDAITMRNHSYEEWLKSDEFFDVKHFPQIHFVSDPVPLERLRSGGEIAGTLSLRGIERPVRLQLRRSDCTEAVASACAAEASGTIRRSEFGMRSRRGTLSDKVELGFSIFLAGPIPEAGHGR
jgi:polyisoprenoid-binding protein YceI